MVKHNSQKDCVRPCCMQGNTSCLQHTFNKTRTFNYPATLEELLGIFNTNALYPPKEFPVPVICL